MEKCFFVVLKIGNKSIEKVLVKNLRPLNKALNIFVDVSGHLSYRVSFWNSKLFGDNFVLQRCRSKFFLSD